MELYHAISAAESLACDKVPISSAVKATLQAGLNADNLESVLSSLQAIEAGATRRHLAVADFDLTTVAARVMELSEDDDSSSSTLLFRSRVEAEDANAARALRSFPHPLPASVSCSALSYLLIWICVSS